MTLPWLRLYREWASDPKVQMMPDHMQRRHIMLLCTQGETLHETERAFHWRISEAELAETKALFIEKGFIDERWNVLNWDRRQFLSDSSTERVRRYRRAKKHDETLLPTNETFHHVSEIGNCVSVTAPEQIRPDHSTAKQTTTKIKFVLPEWISVETWKNFEEMRKKQRAPLTDRARSNIVGKLAEMEKQGECVDEVLNMSITRSWRDVFPIKKDAGGNNGPKFGNRGQQRTDGNLDASRRATADIAGQSFNGIS